VFAKGPTYREPKSINRKHNFKILMDSVEDYARLWTKREKEDLDILSEWVKSVRSLTQIRIKKNSVGLSALALHQSLKIQMLLSTCFSFMTNMSLSPPTKPIAILFVCVNHIT
jgi:hypothetical protein